MSEATRESIGPAGAKKTAEEMARAAAAPPKGGPVLPQINLATFIFSLNQSALLHLGVLDDPVTGVKGQNLALAKQTIDILGMLEEKTCGNRTPDEEKMLKSILYDLRIIYVKENR